MKRSIYAKLLATVALGLYVVVGGFAGIDGIHGGPPPCDECIHGGPPPCDECIHGGPPPCDDCFSTTAQL